MRANAINPLSLDVLANSHDPHCVTCGEEVTVGLAVSVGDDEDENEDEKEVMELQDRNGLADAVGAAKTEQLITILKATERGVKSLVFSQVSLRFTFPNLWLLG